VKPSDYWRRQCKGTFQFDRIGTKPADVTHEITCENAGKFYGLM
jgi:hypothetical protein